jgi:hypothetical protein
MTNDKAKYTKINKKRNLPNNEDFLDVLSKSNGLSTSNPALTALDIIPEVNANLVLENTNNTTTSVAIYGVNVITTSTSVDRACKLPIAKTGRSAVFINNSTLPILVFPSMVGGEINGVVDGFAVIPNDSRAYTFYCIENPLPGAWTWSPPATAQYDSGEITCNTISGAGLGRYNIGISDNYHQESDNSGLTSTYWVFDCQSRDLIATYAPDFEAVSAGDTGGVSGAALSANIMNVTKIKIYTNAHVSGGWIFAGINIGCGTSIYDSDQPGGTFITNGPASALSGVVSTTGETWTVVPGATLPVNTLSPNIGDPGTYYLTWSPPIVPGFNANYINLGPPQYIGPHTTAGQHVWYMGAWQFFIKPDVNFTDFKYRFIIEYN